jgi:hypothetical protein
MVARWRRSSREIYGRGPGIDVMPDVKTLHQQAKTNLRAGQKAVEPPLNVPEGYAHRVRTTPAAINYYSEKDLKVEPMHLGADLPVGIEMMRDQRERVKSGFYADVFLMLMQTPKTRTATEVVELVQERLTVLGPALQRLQTEALGPCVVRTFNLALRAGYLSPAPPVMAGATIEIEYTSPLAKAQRAMEGRATQEALQLVFPILEVDPEAKDVLDTDKLVRRPFEVYGAPLDLLRSEKEVAAIREQRAQQAQQAQLMEQMGQGAEIAKAAAEAEAVAGGM